MNRTILPRKGTERRLFCSAWLLGACAFVSLGTLRADNKHVAPQTEDSETARVAAIAMHSFMGDPAKNLDSVEQWCIKAHQAGARFAVFPEECITGSLNKSDIPVKEAERIVDAASEEAISRLESICRRLDMTLVVGTIQRDGDKFRNSALIVGPQGYLATFHKLWLPNGTERKYFNAGTSLPIVTSQGWKLSVGICADLNRGEYFQAAAEHGAELYLLPVGGSGLANLVGPDGDQTQQAQSHKSLHLKLMQAHATNTGMYVFYANQAGHSGNAWFPGLSLAVDPDGRLVDEHLATEGMTVTVVSKKVLAGARKSPGNDSSLPSGRHIECRNSAGQVINVRIVSGSGAR